MYVKTKQTVLEDAQDVYFLGYSDGFTGRVPDSNQAQFERDVYILGYANGSMNRDNGSPYLVLPKWMTKPQFASILKLWWRDSSRDEYFGLNFTDVLKVVEDYGDYCGLRWCGMFLGIEKDGYTHS